jgi:Uma2 family endonuclease
VDEYYRMAETGVLRADARVELIEGEIIDMAPIGSRHASLVSALAEQLIGAAGAAAVVWIQSPVRLGARSEPQPDLALLKRRPDRYASDHPTAADVLLVVEVSESTLAYDRDVKADLYARHGIPELWIVDAAERRLEIFRDPRDGRYADRSVAVTGTLPIPTSSRGLAVAGLFAGWPDHGSSMEA